MRSLEVEYPLQIPLRFRICEENAFLKAWKRIITCVTSETLIIRDFRNYIRDMVVNALADRKILFGRGSMSILCLPDHTKDILLLGC